MPWTFSQDTIASCVDMLPTLVPLSLLANLQADCPNVAILDQLPSLHVVEDAHHRKSVLVDISMPSPCLLVPSKLQDDVIRQFHNLHHLGVQATRYLVSTTHVLRGMHAHVRNYGCNCHKCNTAKIT